MTKPLIIAVDGPSGSGKSSVAKAVARHYGLEYLDTGAMYRALTWYCLEQGLDSSDEQALVEAARTFPYQQGTSPDEEVITVGGVDVREAIRQPRISEAVSAVASNRQVRQILIDLQRSMIAAAPAGMVAEGRDITTVVAPDVAAQVTGRDAKDSQVTSFTQAAEGVTLVDSSDLTYEETVEALIAAVEAARSAS